jgi:precorrin-6A/cobalt-precorrin-6A reductase
LATGEVPKRLWLIGGTSESAQIAEAIAPLKLPCTITVTTAAATALYPQIEFFQIIVGQIDPYNLDTFFQQQQIGAVLDASHPHAVAVSQGAMASAARWEIPYLRYERPSLSLETQAGNVIALESFDALLAGNYLHQQRVLLTVGCKPLPQFQSWQDHSTLFARTLPTANSIEVALSAGFTSDRIIALRPPISAELEKALWHHWQISLVVTKASGKAGGEEVKQAAAAELGIPLIVITRPSITYPQQTSDLSEVLAFCRQHILLS